MSWATPSFFWLFWLVPVLLAMLIYSWRQSQQSLARFVDKPMAARLAPPTSRLRFWVKTGALLTAVVAAVIALARPQYGHYFEDVSAQGAEVFVLLDVSRSMLAEDVTPNRLARAKSDILDLLERMPSDRIGLIAFAGAPSVQVPLTLDHGFFKMILQDIGPESAPRGGTMIGDAIRKAMEQFEKSSQSDRAIVLITDGGDQDSLPVEAAKLAAERKIRIISVGLGDPSEGARIPQRSAGGELKYLQHDGQEVWSKMEDKTLKEIAIVTSGAYIPAQTRNYDLGQIYSDNLEKLRRGELFVEKRKRFYERFQIPAGIAVVLLLIEQAIASYSPKEST
jgi:Ca-activated chloride channel homolog